MCILVKKLGTEPQEVYKVVAFKKGKIYSLAMGFEYKVGNVPRITKQKRITEHFYVDILKILLEGVPTSVLKNSRGRGFRYEMMGRTAGFTKKENTKELINDASFGLQKGYKIKIAKFTLSKALMSGHYGINGVIGGRHIDKIEVLKGV